MSIVDNIEAGHFSTDDDDEPLLSPGTQTQSRLACPPTILPNSEDVGADGIIIPAQSQQPQPPGSACVTGSGWRKYIGLTLALISSFSFALNSLASKILVGSYSIFLVAFVRAIGVILPSAVCMAHARYVQMDPIFDAIKMSDKKTIAAVLGRGLCGAVVTIGVAGAFKFVGVGDTLVLKSCSPLLVAFFASCFLNESLGLIPVICGIQVILGVMCISKPPFITGEQNYDMNSLFGTLLGLSVAMAAAFGIICIRYARKLHFSIPAISMGIVASLISGIVCAATGGFTFPNSIKDALLFLAVATCTAVTQILMVIALKYDTAGRTSLIRTSEVFFGFFLQIVCLGAVPEPISAIGAIVVILAVIIAVAGKK